MHVMLFANVYKTHDEYLDLDAYDAQFVLRTCKQATVSKPFC